MKCHLLVLTKRSSWGVGGKAKNTSPQLLPTELLDMKPLTERREKKEPRTQRPVFETKADSYNFLNALLGAQKDTIIICFATPLRSLTNQTNQGHKGGVQFTTEAQHCTMKKLGCFVQKTNKQTNLKQNSSCYLGSLDKTIRMPTI